MERGQRRSGRRSHGLNSPAMGRLCKPAHGRLKISRKSAKTGLTNLNISVIIHFAFGGVAQLARAFGSYPKCHRFESSRRYQVGRLRRPTAIRPVGQVVKTPPFHGGNMGSNPVRVTRLLGGLAQQVRAPASHAGGHWFESSSLHQEKPCNRAGCRAFPIPRCEFGSNFPPARAARGCGFPARLCAMCKLSQGAG